MWPCTPKAFFLLFALHYENYRQKYSHGRRNIVCWHYCSYEKRILSRAPKCRQLGTFCLLFACWTATTTIVAQNEIRSNSRSGKQSADNSFQIKTPRFFMVSVCVFGHGKLCWSARMSTCRVAGFDCTLPCRGDAHANGSLIQISAWRLLTCRVPCYSILYNKYSYYVYTYLLVQLLAGSLCGRALPLMTYRASERARTSIYMYQITLIECSLARVVIVVVGPNS